MYGIRLSLKTTITGDIQIEIIGAAFFVEENCPNERFGDWWGGREGRVGAGGDCESLFSSSVCVCMCVLGRCVGGHKQLHLLLRRTLPQLMISDDIIRQSAHKQMLEALPKQCQLSRFAFL